MAERHRESRPKEPEASATARSASNGDRGQPVGHERAAAGMEREIQKKESRKLKARQEKHRSIWFGLGMFGMIGWSVAVPAVLGVALGWWIDRAFPSRYSWTLMLLILGVVIGCLTAWNWVQKESRS